MNHVIKSFDRPHCKITVEEVSTRRNNGITHIATYWDKNDCLESDRVVYEFETFGGACDQALDLLDNATIKSEAEMTALLERFIDPKVPSFALRAHALEFVSIIKKHYLG